MRNKVAVVIVAAVVATAGVGTFVYLQQPKGGGGGAPPGGQMMPQVPVFEVIARDVAPSADFTGYLTAPQTVELRSRVSGAIDAVTVPEGGLVKKGQVLFVIDPRPYQVTLDAAQAQLNQAEVVAAQAKAEFDRSSRLVATGAVSQKIFDDAQAQYRQRQAQVQSAKAAVDAAKLDLSFTRVTAPISGRVDRALVTAGNLVAGGGAGAPTLLTTIVSVDPVHVLFDMDEATYLGFVKGADGGGRPSGNLPVQVGLMTDTDHPFQGRLDFVGNGVDRGSGTVKARAVVANSDGRLTPGLFARVKLVTGAPQPSILIDDQAVGADQGRNFVLLLGKGDMVEYRPIELGPVVDGLRVVKSGLSAGDKVIVKGLVRPGMQVKPKMVPAGTGGSEAPAVDANAAAQKEAQ